MLVVDGVKLSQQNAILRYIADINDMGPKEPLEVCSPSCILPGPKALMITLSRTMITLSRTTGG